MCCLLIFKVGLCFENQPHILLGQFKDHVNEMPDEGPPLHGDGGSGVPAYPLTVYPNKKINLRDETAVVL